MYVDAMYQKKSPFLSKVNGSFQSCPDSLFNGLFYSHVAQSQVDSFWNVLGTAKQVHTHTGSDLAALREG